MNKEGRIIRGLYRSTVVSIIISAVAAMFGMLIDGVIIGKFLGTDCMAAYGLVTPLFSIITAVSGVLAIGAQVSCAKQLGAGKADRARQIFSVCILATVIISLIAIVILLIFCRPLCTIMGAKKMRRNYCRWQRPICTASPRGSCPSCCYLFSTR